MSVDTDTIRGIKYEVPKINITLESSRTYYHIPKWSHVLNATLLNRTNGEDIQIHNYLHTSAKHPLAFRMSNCVLEDFWVKRYSKFAFKV